MLNVETSTSRAAKLAISATPIFQSNPRGAITGSITRPSFPAKLFRSCSLSPALASGCESEKIIPSAAATFPSYGTDSVLGKYISAQRMMEIARITVPARFTNNQDRSSMFVKTDRRFGIRYGGSYIINRGGGAFKTVRFEMNA